ncbi:unnamed protein product [Amoebophrya sp. A120]|nr:unnamed protein product [Amoebophrya sp. A120]|eukprot:GSA120T00020537001.1
MPSTSPVVPVVPCSRLIKPVVSEADLLRSIRKKERSSEQELCSRNDVKIVSSTTQIQKMIGENKENAPGQVQIASMNTDPLAESRPVEKKLEEGSSTKISSSLLFQRAAPKRAAAMKSTGRGGQEDNTIETGQDITITAVPAPGTSPSTDKTDVLEDVPTLSCAQQTKDESQPAPPSSRESQAAPPSCPRRKKGNKVLSEADLLASMVQKSTSARKEMKLEKQQEPAPAQPKITSTLHDDPREDEELKNHTELQSGELVASKQLRQEDKEEDDRGSTQDVEKGEATTLVEGPRTTEPEQREIFISNGEDEKRAVADELWSDILVVEHEQPEKEKEQKAEHDISKQAEKQLERIVPIPPLEVEEDKAPTSTANMLAEEPERKTGIAESKGVMIGGVVVPAGAREDIDTSPPVEEDDHPQHVVETEEQRRKREAADNLWADLGGGASGTSTSEKNKKGRGLTLLSAAIKRPENTSSKGLFYKASAPRPGAGAAAVVPASSSSTSAAAGASGDLPSGRDLHKSGDRGTVYDDTEGVHPPDEAKGNTTTEGINVEEDDTGLAELLQDHDTEVVLRDEAKGKGSTTSTDVNVEEDDTGLAELLQNHGVLSCRVLVHDQEHRKEKNIATVFKFHDEGLTDPTRPMMSWRRGPDGELALCVYQRPATKEEIADGKLKDNVNANGEELELILEGPIPIVRRRKWFHPDNTARPWWEVSDEDDAEQRPRPEQDADPHTVLQPELGQKDPPAAPTAGSTSKKRKKSACSSSSSPSSGSSSSSSGSTSSDDDEAGAGRDNIPTAHQPKRPPPPKKPALSSSSSSSGSDDSGSDDSSSDDDEGAGSDRDDVTVREPKRPPVPETPASQRRASSGKQGTAAASANQDVEDDVRCRGRTKGTGRGENKRDQESNSNAASRPRSRSGSSAAQSDDRSRSRNERTGILKRDQSGQGREAPVDASEAEVAAKWRAQHATKAAKGVARVPVKNATTAGAATKVSVSARTRAEDEAVTGAPHQTTSTPGGAGAVTESRAVAAAPERVQKMIEANQGVSTAPGTKVPQGKNVTSRRAASGGVKALAKGVVQATAAAAVLDAEIMDVLAARARPIGVGAASEVLLLGDLANATLAAMAGWRRTKVIGTSDVVVILAGAATKS